MKLHWAVPLLISLIPPSIAVFADEAYHTDFHHALIGFPQASTTFFQLPWAASKAALIYTLSEKNVLAAVNPRDGSIIWRQQLAGKGEDASVLRRVEGGDTLVAVAGGAASAWIAADGKLSWDYTAQDGFGEVVDVEILDMASTAGAGVTKDAVVLLAGSDAVVQRLDGASGEVKWSYKDNSGDVPYRVSASATNIFVITYHKTLLHGLKLRVTKLDPVTGTKVEEHSLSSENDISTPQDIIFLGSNSGSLILVWIDSARSVLKVNILGTTKLHSLNLKESKGTLERVQVLASSRNHASPHFLVYFQTADSHWAEVYHIDLKTSSITKAYDVPTLAGKGAFSVTTVDANVFFTRITDDEMILLSSASHGVLGRWKVTNLRTSGTSESVHPLHATSEVVARGASTYAVRSAVLLSNGDWVLLRNGEKDWVRTESLAGVVKAVWVPPMARQELAEALETESHSDPVSGYIHRIRRHIDDFRSIQVWLRSVPQLILEKLPMFGAKDDLTVSERAFFGFDKRVLVATDNGRVMALEPGNRGRILWNLKAIDLPQGRQWTASDAGPVLAELLKSGGSLLDGSAPFADLSNGESLLSEMSHVASIGPDTASADAVTYLIKDGTLQGYKGSTRLWQFSPPYGQVLGGISSAILNEPIASIGKVLGDRTVLYKYINPNTVLATGINGARREISAYLLDAVSGTVLFSATHGEVDTSRPLTSAVTENWFAYAFTSDPGTDTSSKGYQLVFNELLESTIPNDRGILAAALNSSMMQPATLASRPVAISQTFQVPEEIVAMGITQTLQGITSRELLVALGGSNGIVGIPRAALDPRRTVGKDPSRTQLEEGLSRYAPMLDFDPRWYLNHKQEVIGIKKIVTAPALLESTSLVFAYGHDLFGTRIAPSFAFDVLGNSFNKVQLLLTVAALTVGVFFVAPLIQRKQTNLLWTST